MEGQKILAAALFLPLLICVTNAVNGPGVHDSAFPFSPVWERRDASFVIAKPFIITVDRDYRGPNIRIKDTRYVSTFINTSEPNGVDHDVVIHVHWDGMQLQHEQTYPWGSWTRRGPQSDFNFRAADNGLSSMYRDWSSSIYQGHNEPGYFGKPFIRVGAPESLLVDGIGRYTCSAVPVNVSAKSFSVSSLAGNSTLTNSGCTAFNLPAEKGRNHRLRITKVPSWFSYSLNFTLEESPKVFVPSTVRNRRHTRSPSDRRQDALFETNFTFSFPSLEGVSARMQDEEFEVQPMVVDSDFQSLKNVRDRKFLAEVEAPSISANTSSTSPLNRSIDRPLLKDHKESEIDRFLKSWAVNDPIPAGLILVFLIYLGNIFFKAAARCMKNLGKKLRENFKKTIDKSKIRRGQSNLRDQSTDKRHEPKAAIDPHGWKTKRTGSVKRKYYRKTIVETTVVARTVTESTEVYEETVDR